MAKFDLSKLTEKIDIDKITKTVKSGVESVKETVSSVVSPGSQVPKAKEGDVVGAKMAEILVCVNKLIQEHEQHAKAVTNLRRMVVDLQRLLAQMQAAEAGEGSTPSKPAATKPHPGPTHGTTSTPTTSTAAKKPAAPSTGTTHSTQPTGAKSTHEKPDTPKAGSAQTKPKD